MPRSGSEDRKIEYKGGTDSSAISKRKAKDALQRPLSFVCVWGGGGVENRGRCKVPLKPKQSLEARIDFYTNSPKEKPGSKMKSVCFFLS
jgi:hypothetical protein